MRPADSLSHECCPFGRCVLPLAVWIPRVAVTRDDRPDVETIARFARAGNVNIARSSRRVGGVFQNEDLTPFRKVERNFIRFLDCGRGFDSPSFPVDELSEPWAKGFQRCLVGDLDWGCQVLTLNGDLVDGSFGGDRRGQDERPYQHCKNNEPNLEHRRPALSAVDVFNVGRQSHYLRVHIWCDFRNLNSYELRKRYIHGCSRTRTLDSSFRFASFGMTDVGVTRRFPVVGMAVWWQGRITRYRMMTRRTHRSLQCE